VSQYSASIVLSSSSAFSINSAARGFPLDAKERMRFAKWPISCLREYSCPNRIRPTSCSPGYQGGCASLGVSRKVPVQGLFVKSIMDNFR